MQPFGCSIWRAACVADSGRSTRLVEDGGGGQLDPQLRNRQGRHLRQAGVAGVHAPRVGIDQPDVWHAPVAVDFQFLAQVLELVVEGEDFDGDPRRRIGITALRFGGVKDGNI